MGCSMIRIKKKVGVVLMMQLAMDYDTFGITLWNYPLANEMMKSSGHTIYTRAIFIRDLLLLVILLLSLVRHAKILTSTTCRSFKD
jgi:hypothetical protein